MPVRPTMLATTTAKKLFNPIPGAMANGLFATNAITIIPIKDAMGSGYTQMVLTVVTMFIGLFVIIVLAQKGVKAAVILGTKLAPSRLANGLVPRKIASPAQ